MATKEIPVLLSKQQCIEPSEEINSPRKDHELLESSTTLPNEQDRRAVLGCWVTILAATTTTSPAESTSSFGNISWLSDDDDCLSSASSTNGKRQTARKSVDFVCPFSSFDSDDDDAVSLTSSIETDCTFGPSTIVEKPPRKEKLRDSIKKTADRFKRKSASSISKFKARSESTISKFKERSESSIKKHSERVKKSLNKKKIQRRAQIESNARRRHRFHRDLLLTAGQSLGLEETYVEGLLPLLCATLGSDDDESPIQRQQQRIDCVMNACLPFLDSFSEPCAGFRCVVLLLTKSILNSSYGYDARYRSNLKKLAIVVFLYENNYNDDCFDIEEASTLFHQLENSIGSKLLLINMVQTQLRREHDEPQSSRRHLTKREKLIRGLKLAGVGLAAGALLGVTGGLAAPAVMAVGGAVGGITFTGLTAALTTLFGVGGGAYVAHKVHRRTKGLTEFALYKEYSNEDDPDGALLPQIEDAQLFSTIVISGWIRDQSDFQRPWGVHPTNPPIKDKKELLQRFYSIYNPERIKDCSLILSEWKGHEDFLWAHLKWKYGSDPDDPFGENRVPKPKLSRLHDKVVEDLCVDLQLCPSVGIFDAHREVTKAISKSEQQERQRKNEKVEPDTDDLVDSMHGPRINQTIYFSPCPDYSYKEGDDISIEPQHVQNVWDYRNRYYGELYTTRFEGQFLKQFCSHFHKVIAGKAVSYVAGQTIRVTTFAGLAAALAVPAGLLALADLIDTNWSIILARADEAGVELAQSLMESSRDGAGRRPVTLVGYSFGARIIYSCLRELARLQGEWEKKQLVEHDTTVMMNREPASIVEDVVLMGLPHNITSSFPLVRQMVAGRFVNCFSTRDWFLNLMFNFRQATDLKVANAHRPVAGAEAIGIREVEDVDVSDLVDAQSDYCRQQNDILQRVRLGHPSY